jgi:hypothetical protein
MLSPDSFFSASRYVSGPLDAASSVSEDDAPAPYEESVSSGPSLELGVPSSPAAGKRRRPFPDGVRTRVSDGVGVLCCRIEGGHTPADVAGSMIKVSYVEPRAGNEGVMFRSKQVVHQTGSKIVERGEEAWPKSSFEYELFPPEGGDWFNLEGDLLFTVYESSRHTFVGQVLLPLAGLVERGWSHAYGGTQRAVVGVFPLTQRDGKTLKGGGQLALRAHLELPPDEPVTPGGTGPEGFTGELKSPGSGSRRGRSPKSAGAGDKQGVAARAAAGGPQKAKAKTKGGKGAPGSKRLVRDRALKLVAIQKENLAMQKRLLEVKRGALGAMTGAAAPAGKPGSARSPSLKAYSAPAQTRPMPVWASANEEGYRGDNEMIALSESLQALTTRLATAKEDVTHLRAAVAREAANLKRNVALHAEVAQAQHELASRKVVQRVAASRLAPSAATSLWTAPTATSRRTPAAGKAREGCSLPQRRVSAGALEALRNKAARSLELCEAQNAKVRDLERRIAAADKRAAAAEARRKRAAAALREADRRGAGKAAALLKAQAEAEQEEEQDPVLAAQARERETRVRISVARNELADARAAAELEAAAQEQALAELDAKTHRKREKEAEARALREALEEKVARGEAAAAERREMLHEKLLGLREVIEMLERPSARFAAAVEKKQQH